MGKKKTIAAVDASPKTAAPETPTETPAASGAKFGVGARVKIKSPGMAIDGAKGEIVAARNGLFVVRPDKDILNMDLTATEEQLVAA